VGVLTAIGSLWLGLGWSTLPAAPGATVTAAPKVAIPGKITCALRNCPVHAALLRSNTKGVIAMAADDDDAVDLGISLETVANIVDLARAIEGKEETDPEQEDEDPDSPAGLLQETEEDATSEVLTEIIESLNTEEQAALIALAWTGRGDYDASEWPDAIKLAGERNSGGGTANYLLDMDLLGDLLAEGVAAFGLSIEDVTRWRTLQRS